MKTCLALLTWAVATLGAAVASGQIVVPSATAGRWVSTGDLRVTRSEHTATLLPNGKVLIAGSGSDDSGSAEIYDPATGTWSATGKMNTYRSQHQAALLKNGKVLVVGGYVSAPAYGAELFDPDAGTWTLASAPRVLRHSHTVTVLQDGRVLVAGGFFWPELGNPHVYGPIIHEPVADLYDPLTDTWHPVGSMLTPRIGHSATLLPDGRVLVTGGVDRAGERLGKAEMFDPVTASWSPVEELTHGKDGHTATLLPDGSVLVAGIGNVRGAWDNNTQALLDQLVDRTSALFDPVAGHWRGSGALNTGRFLHTATLLPGGDVLVAGGNDYSGFSWGWNYPVGALASAEIYDTKRGTWSHTAGLNTARLEHSATLLLNGEVLVVGGYDMDGNTLKTAEVFKRGVLRSSELYQPGAVEPVPIEAGHTGSWYNPAQSGHGFALEVLPGAPMRLLASWFTFAPQGGQSWIVGLGAISGKQAVLQGYQSVGSGGRFPPNFAAEYVHQQNWGTLTFTFSDCNHGYVEWASSIPGYGSGGMDLTRLTSPAGLRCSP